MENAVSAYPAAEGRNQTTGNSDPAKKALWIIMIHGG